VNTTLRCGLMALALLLASMQAAHADFIASSTFETGDDGWKVVSTHGYEGPVTWSATGGHPGGFIWGQDPDTGAFGFAAPAAFLGNVSAAYGHDLTFDVAAYQAPDQPTSWVGMRGTNGLELICHYDTPTSVYPAWHGRAIGMTEDAGWIRVSDGQPPTSGQFASVLTSLDGLVILAEFVDGLPTDISGLDNVILLPEPATLSLLLIPAATALLRRARRQRTTLHRRR